MEKESRIRGNELGETARTVAANIHRIRKARGLTLKELADAMAGLGLRLSFSAVSKVENVQRTVDVDELMAFAAALDVSPLDILLPSSKPVEPQMDAFSELIRRVVQQELRTNDRV